MKVDAESGRAAQVDFAAKQAGQFAADGEPKARAAVLAAGGGIRLLERLEDDLLLLVRDADAGVGNFERDHGRAPGSAPDDPRLQPPSAADTFSRTPPWP